MTNEPHNNENEAREALAKLDWDIQPERDLWPAISSNIRFTDSHRKKSARLGWSQAAIAACLIMAVVAVGLSSLSYYRAQQAYQMQANYIEYQKSQINLIEQQHKHVRAQFLALLDGQFGDIDAGTANEIRTVLMTIDSASAQLKQAILSQPLNSRYPIKLARTYQEELRLLNKFKRQNGTTI